MLALDPSVDVAHSVEITCTDMYCHCCMYNWPSASCTYSSDMKQSNLCACRYIWLSQGQHNGVSHSRKITSNLAYNVAIKQTNKPTVSKGWDSRSDDSLVTSSALKTDTVHSVETSESNTIYRCHKPRDCNTNQLANHSSTQPNVN